eukprot:56357-Chlamydomonas_euryale.AAC.9
MQRAHIAGVTLHSKCTGSGIQTSHALPLPGQVVESLLDEVVAAGVERAADPQLLEPLVLDRIIECASIS